MRATQVARGREFVVAIDYGEDFFTALNKLCAEHESCSGYIPAFIGGFRYACLVGACGPLANPEAPLSDHIEVESLEALGGGTLAWDPEVDCLALHVSAGCEDCVRRRAHQPSAGGTGAVHRRACRRGGHQSQPDPARATRLVQRSISHARGAALTRRGWGG